MNLEALVVMQTAAAAGENAEQLGRALGLGMSSLALIALMGIWLLVKVGFVGMAAWFTTGYPGASTRMLELYETRGVRCFIVGAMNIVVGLFVALLLFATQVLGLLGLLLLLALAAGIVAGYSVAYRHVGTRVVSNPNATHVRLVATGGLVAESAFMVPVLGQLLSLGMLCRGFGAVAMALLAWRRNPAPGAPQEPGESLAE